MPAIPPFILRKLYVKGSLRPEDGGFSLCLNNVIAPGTITGIAGLTLDGTSVDLSRVEVTAPAGNVRLAAEISSQDPLEFPIGSEVRLMVGGHQLAAGAVQLAIRVVVKDVGPLQIPISDTLG
jgi:hypothetical protein